MMTDSPLISCIVPTFNSADYVRHALESVFSLIEAFLFGE